MAGRRGQDEEGYEEEGYGPPEKKNNTPLIVGIVAGAVVLIIVIIVIASSGGDEQQPDRRRNRGIEARGNQPMAPLPPGPTPAPVPYNPFPGSDVPAEKPKPKRTTMSAGVWGETIDGLKLYASAGYGGDFYDYEDPVSKKAFERVKSLGANAYPYLIAFITDPDPQRGRGAVVALKNLNGDPRKGKSPGRLNPNTCQSYASEWMQILGIDSARVESARQELGIGKAQGD
jgi:hypothetical protein